MREEFELGQEVVVRRSRMAGELWKRATVVRPHATREDAYITCAGGRREYYDFVEVDMPIVTGEGPAIERRLILNSRANIRPYQPEPGA